ncbi:mg2+ transporter zinc transport protein [Diplodia corticola]|uniref:Mg2+ transporter zinc transport protein n=1 Tax=Diplodia corticola TaxID=236234 RepID=A0A1J9RI19_9PEZI|nr:mg2+ transporter zinc transport protein [Diplodia corticola]OJD40288.1 mg2+ transporter zinc transport protein [Diplodia corticola]
MADSNSTSLEPAPDLPTTPPNPQHLSQASLDQGGQQSNMFQAKTEGCHLYKDLSPLRTKQAKIGPHLCLSLFVGHLALDEVVRPENQSSAVATDAQPPSPKETVPESKSQEEPQAEADESDPEEDSCDELVKPTPDEKSKDFQDWTECEFVDDDVPKSMRLQIPEDAQPEARNRPAYASFGSNGTTVAVNAPGNIMQISRYFGLGRSGFFCADSDFYWEPDFPNYRLEEFMEHMDNANKGFRLGLESLSIKNRPTFEFVYDRWPRFTFHHSQAARKSTGELEGPLTEDKVNMESREPVSGDRSSKPATQFTGAQEKEEQSHPESLILSLQCFCYRETVFQRYVFDGRDSLPKATKWKINGGIPLRNLDFLDVSDFNSSSDNYDWKLGYRKRSLIRIHEITDDVASEMGVTVPDQEQKPRPWAVALIITPFINGKAQIVQQEEGQKVCFSKMIPVGRILSSRRNIRKIMGNTFSREANTPFKEVRFSNHHHLNFMIGRNLEHILSVCSIPIPEDLDSDPTISDAKSGVISSGDENLHTGPMAFTCGPLSGHRIDTASSLYVLSCLKAPLYWLRIASLSKSSLQRGMESRVASVECNVLASTKQLNRTKHPWQQRKILELVIFDLTLSEIESNTGVILSWIRRKVLENDDWNGTEKRGERDEGVNQKEVGTADEELKVISDDHDIAASTPFSPLALSLEEGVKFLEKGDSASYFSIIKRWRLYEQNRRESDRKPENPRWTMNDEKEFRPIINKLLVQNQRRHRDLERLKTTIQTFRQFLSGRLESIRDDMSFRGSENMSLFTYVTVIFLPLGFATGIFSMSEAPARLTLASMAVTAAISLFVTVFTLVNAETLGDAMVKPAIDLAQSCGRPLIFLSLFAAYSLRFVLLAIQLVLRPVLKPVYKYTLGPVLKYLKDEANLKKYKGMMDSFFPLDKTKEKENEGIPEAQAGQSDSRDGSESTSTGVPHRKAPPPKRRKMEPTPRQLEAGGLHRSALS